MRLPLRLPKSANALRHWKKPLWRGREVLRARKGKRGVQVLRAPQVHRAEEDSRVLKGRKGQKEKRGIQVLRAPQVHRAKEDSPALRGLQGQREIPQIPAGCNSLRTAFPNWKRDSRRQARELMDGLCFIEGSVELRWSLIILRGGQANSFFAGCGFTR
jgi:hypothetical protein